MANNVFIIDCLDSMRALMRMVLRDTSYQVVGEAATLDAALEKIAHQQVDLVILDRDMPDRSGVNCIPMLKERFPHLVIVIASTKRDAASVQSALQQGALGYVIKPFAAGTMQDAMERALRRHSNAGSGANLDAAA